MTILDTVAGGPLDTTGEVRFAATFEQGGRPGAVVEHSRFERLPDGWVYLDEVAP